MRATHATSVLQMREGTFDPLATLAHQSAAFIVPDPVNPASKWLRPNSVLQARFVKIGAQLDV